jgi:hypothetical protein
MMELKDLLKDQAKCDELLSELDAIAVDVSSFEFGLPMYDDGAKARMREALYRWAASGTSNAELIDPVVTTESPLFHPTANVEDMKIYQGISDNYSKQGEVVAWLVDGRLEQGLFFDKASAEIMSDMNCGTVRPLVFGDNAPQSPKGWKLVPIEPTDDHLTSMAVRYDHGLGVAGHYDTHPIQLGATHAQRMEATKVKMRQLYEEAIGEGFYNLPTTPTDTE